MGQIRIDEEKLKKLHNMNEYMDEKYGKVGTPRREALHEEAMRWYYGELLKDRRQALKMTQQQLAERVGQERSYIARIEEGESDVRLAKHCRGIGTDPVFLSDDRAGNGCVV